MPSYSDLTDLQLAILGALWERGEATIAELHEALDGRVEVSRKTIATLLGRMERRRLVRHRLVGREGVYRAIAPRRAVLLSRINGVLGALLPAPPRARAAGARAVDASEVRDGDVARILDLLRAAERDLKAGE